MMIEHACPKVHLMEIAEDFPSASKAEIYSMFLFEVFGSEFATELLDAVVSDMCESVFKEVFEDVKEMLT